METKVFLIWLAFVLTVTLAYADTPIIGFVAQDTVWTRAGSPYVSLGTVVVEEGATLTIEPGVTIKFDSGHSLMIDGKLIARGSADDTIKFTPKENDIPGAWEGILFEDSTVDAEFDEAGNYLSGSILQYCIVEFAESGVKGESAAPFIDHCMISNNSGAGITISESEGDIAVIRDSTVADNEGDGIYVEWLGSISLTGNTVKGNNHRGIQVSAETVVISDNTVTENAGGGIYVEISLTATISNNELAGNVAEGDPCYGGGIHVRSVSANVTNNTLTGNSAKTSYGKGYGGGIYANCDTAIISNNTFTGNMVIAGTPGTIVFFPSSTSYAAGGGLCVNCNTATISNNTFTENKTEDNVLSGGRIANLALGGGIYVAYGNVTVIDNTLSENEAHYGGGICVVNGTAAISGNVLIGNIGDNGGGILTYTGCTINNNTLVENVGSYGGGIRVGAGTSTISNNTVINNAAYVGGGIYVRKDSAVGTEKDAVVAITGNVITGNHVKYSNGAAIYYIGSKEITGNLIANSASDGDEGSNAVYIKGNPTFNDNAIIGNKTTYNLYYDQPKGSPELDATNNHWGVTTEAEIRARIHDFFQDNKLAIVNVAPFLTENPFGEEPDIQGTASFTYSPSLEKFLSGQEIIFKAAADSENIVSYEWNFGDDKTDAGPVVRHRFKGIPDQSTTYAVTLTVRDNIGYTDTYETGIAVLPIKKTAEIIYKTIGEPTTIGATVWYNWVGMDRDGKDIFKISKIDTWNHYFVGYYVVSIESKDRTLWKKRIIIGPPFWRSYSPEELLIVNDSDWMSVKAYGITEAELLNWIALLRGAMGDETFGDGQAKLLFTKSATAYLAPDYVDTSDFPLIGAEDIEIAALTIGHIGSPAELRVYDSQGQVTGLVNGEVKEEIPNSAYFDDTFVILSSSNLCRYEVAGTDEGTYELGVISARAEEVSIFVASDIPISPQAIHQYAIDWDALSKGEKGATVQVDADGDGTSEQTIVTDNELTQDEYLSAIDVTPTGKYPTTWANLKRTALFQNYPNPFNPDTWIPYTLAEQTRVTIRIHNAAGQLIRTLDLGNKPAGVYLAQEKAAYWNGCNDADEPVAGGVYFYTLCAGPFRATKKMAIAK